MLYYRVLRDKHDNNLINTLQGLNKMLNSDQLETHNHFVKFEHTQFSEQNKKAMALLIILLERKNEILKFLVQISTQREFILNRQQKLQQQLLALDVKKEQSEDSELKSSLIQDQFKQNVEIQKR